MATEEPRWDETWHRLLEWTNGQGPSERLAAQVLMSEGFTGLDPSHPLGGRDGGADATCEREGRNWGMAVYFPRGQQTFSVIKEKFQTDLSAARAKGVDGLAFVTNQELRLAERNELCALWPDHIELFHLERITAIMDRPGMHTVRRQFLNIAFSDMRQGGPGGDATADAGGHAVGGTGGDAGPHGDGGPGGKASSSRKGSLAIGGRGGRGGVGPGMKGGDAIAEKAFGDSAFVSGVVAGGEGGSAPRIDGQGGRGGRSGAYNLGIDFGPLPDGRYPGEGGRGANTAAYDGKVQTVKGLLKEYYREQPEPITSRDAHAAVPLDWLNLRLERMRSGWHVKLDEYDEFEFVDGSSPAQTSGFYAHANEKLLRERSGAATAPKGIALVICRRIEWKDERENASFPRSLLCTFDSLTYDQLPHTSGPFAAYGLISGSGHVLLSLTLEAPTGEVLVACNIQAQHWGELGTCEFSQHIGEFRVKEPGIHNWKLCHKDEVLLQRPIIVRSTEPVEKQDGN